MIFGFGKKKIKWDWLLQNACSLIDGDDKQFDFILETLGSRFQDKFIDFKKDSPEYLYSKYKYRTISISYIVSVLALKLIEEGKIRLDTPLAEIDPRFSKMRVLDHHGHVTPASSLITIEHLLTHRAGFSYDCTLE